MPVVSKTVPSASSCSSALYRASRTSATGSSGGSLALGPSCRAAWVHASRDRPCCELTLASRPHCNPASDRRAHLAVPDAGVNRVQHFAHREVRPAAVRVRPAGRRARRAQGLARAQQRCRPQAHRGVPCSALPPPHGGPGEGVDEPGQPHSGRDKHPARTIGHAVPAVVVERLGDDGHNVAVGQRRRHGVRVVVAEHHGQRRFGVAQNLRDGAPNRNDAQARIRRASVDRAHAGAARCNVRG